jgi:hypothetical protein
MTLKEWVPATLVCLLLTAGTPVLAEQETARSTPSLGELARKLREQRAEAEKKPNKVYTNENLPARPTPGALTVAAGISPAEGSESEPVEVEESTSAVPPTEGVKAKPPAEGTPEPEVKDEKYYRARGSEIRNRLDLQRRQLSVLEQKLSQSQMNFHDDPQKTLLQESSPEFYSEIVKLREDIQNKKEEIAASEKALDDLREEARRGGGNPGWVL